MHSYMISRLSNTNNKKIYIINFYRIIQTNKYELFSNIAK